MFINFLDYKLKAVDGQLVEIGRFFPSSKTCSCCGHVLDRWFPSSKRCGNCGHIVGSMPLNIREWKCPECGTVHQQDINASKNILAAGLAVSVCGANIRPDNNKVEGQLRRPEGACVSKTRKGKKQKPKS